MTLSRGSDMDLLFIPSQLSHCRCLNPDGRGFAVEERSTGWAWTVVDSGPVCDGAALTREAAIEAAVSACRLAGIDPESLPCRQTLDELILLGVAAPHSHEAESVVMDRYQSKDGLYYDLQDSYRLAFEERPTRIVARAPEGGAPFARAMLEVAIAKGCHRIEAKGQEGFRREVWIYGADRHIEIVGFEPRPEDLQERFKRIREPARHRREIPRKHLLASQIDANVFLTLKAVGGAIRARVFCDDGRLQTPECIVQIESGQAVCLHQGKKWGVHEALAESGETYLLMSPLVING